MKLQVNFFGGLKAEINDIIIDLDMLLGKQLSSLFALLIYKHGKVVTKETLYNFLWQDSDNPANALKYAIFRLRNALKEIDEFKDIEFIITVKNGYHFNNDIEIVFDYELFKQAVEEAKETNDLDDYQKALNYYEGDFLALIENDWIYLERAHYKISMINLAEMMCNRCLELQAYNLCLDTCKFALRYDDFNEELIYCYIKALIETKQYNEALKYYDSASKRLNKELGVNLRSKTNSLFSMFSSKETNNNTKTDIDTFSSSLYDKKDLHGPMYCEYEIFKMITEYEIRDCIRNHNNKYLVFITFVNDNYNLDELINIVAKSLRIDDVYTKVSNSQIAILCSLRQVSDAYIVGERIISKYYHRVDSNARLMYNVKLLTEAKLFEGHEKGSLFVVK